MPHYTHAHRLLYMRAMVLVADECIHISDRHVDEVRRAFHARLRRGITSAASVPIELHVVATKSPLLPDDLVFEHDGEYLESRRGNKDLAIVKYCSSGVHDQNGRVYHILNCLSYVASPEEGTLPLIPSENWLVVLVTSDFGPDMHRALKWLRTCTTSASWVVPIRVPKPVCADRKWVKYVADTLARDINAAFSHCGMAGWVLSFPYTQVEP